jgi:phytoene synthase
MSQKTNYSLFRKGKNFYFSSIFFEPSMRDEVATLYAFVRFIDDLVDRDPPNVDMFYRCWDKLDSLWGSRGGPPVLQPFIELAEKHAFGRSSVEAFMKSMEMDLTVDSYESYEDLLRYIYGSAEVVGLFMAKIMRLEEKSYPYAMRLGRAYQLINMIRDIGEDLRLGRIYMPQEDLRMFKVREIGFNTNFYSLVQYELKRFNRELKIARIGFKFIPRRYIIPIETATNIYQDTAWYLYRRPWTVLTTKYRPNRFRYLLNVLRAMTWH